MENIAGIFSSIASLYWIETEFLFQLLLLMTHLDKTFTVNPIFFSVRGTYGH